LENASGESSGNDVQVTNQEESLVHTNGQAVWMCTRINQLRDRTILEFLQQGSFGCTVRRNLPLPANPSVGFMLPHERYNNALEYGYSFKLQDAESLVDRLINTCSRNLCHSVECPHLHIIFVVRSSISHSGLAQTRKSVCILSVSENWSCLVR
jgi:hypothetical protein